jgi:uncharacterized protein
VSPPPAPYRRSVSDCLPAIYMRVREQYPEVVGPWPFQELTGFGYPAIVVSVVSGDGLDQIGPFLFQRVDVVRVYTKVPGRPPDLTRPFTVRRDQTVHDVAELVLKELAEGLRYARLWRDGIEGRQIGRDYHV